MQRLKKLLPTDSQAIAAYILSGALLGFINILFGPLILHKVGLSAYGMLGLAMFTHSLLFTLAEFGVQAHLVSVLANKPAHIRTEIASAFVFKGIAYGLALVAFGAYVLYYPHPREVKALVAVYMSVTLFSSTHAEWFFIGSRLHWDLAKSRILSGCISIFLITWWYFWGTGLWFIPVCSALSQFSAIVYLLSRTGFRDKLTLIKYASWSRVLSLLKELLPMAATQTLSPFTLAAGIFLLDRLHFSKAVLGAYNIPQRVILGWLSLAGPMVLFFIPIMTKNFKKDRFVGHFWYSVLASLVLLPIGMAMIKGFYLFSHADLGFQNYSLKVYAILSIGIFLNFLRIRHVSQMVFEQKYIEYFLIHLTACSPILFIGFVYQIALSPLGVAWLVCMPELIATSLFLIVERTGANKTAVNAVLE
jgi:O-antigen/teichoic acid export membrane protein